jgi:hypothetical protein
MLIGSLPFVAIVVLLFVRPGPIARPEVLAFAAYYWGLFVVDTVLWIIFARRKVNKGLYWATIPCAPVVNIMLAMDWLCIKTFGRDYVEVTQTCY